MPQPPLQSQPDSIPEMELEVLIRVMRTSFGIAHERVEGKPYAVRFVETPFNTFVEDCRHIQIFAHNRGRHVSPHNIKALLSKFEIAEKDFIEAAIPAVKSGVIPETKIPDTQNKGTKPN